MVALTKQGIVVRHRGRSGALSSPMSHPSTRLPPSRNCNPCTRAPANSLTGASFRKLA
ncbi:hypothetical protein [Ornithinimicrobium sp. INDO-MA30-4]|uniref:hypothetical protein n=1 Tax=Ornithinimicrobium sp. INDO-MA30-4 TaxID=2908651 RepID=UPI0037CC7703